LGRGDYLQLVALELVSKTLGLRLLVEDDSRWLNRLTDPLGNVVDRRAIVNDHVILAVDVRYISRLRNNRYVLLRRHYPLCITPI
jgi:hypothetical protein